MVDVQTIWQATDEEGVRVELDHVTDEGYWQLSLEDGPFSGYPTINLTHEDLLKLRAVLDGIEKA